MTKRNDCEQKSENSGLFLGSEPVEEVGRKQVFAQSRDKADKKDSADDDSGDDDSTDSGDKRDGDTIDKKDEDNRDKDSKD
jgi:hypothetical protein